MAHSFLQVLGNYFQELRLFVDVAAFVVWVCFEKVILLLVCFLSFDVCLGMSL